MVANSSPENSGRIADISELDLHNPAQKAAEPGRWDAIGFKSGDSVATALRHLDAGEIVRVNMDGTSMTVCVREEIPLCHKLAVKTIEIDQVILKYGYEIGRATARIREGSHVHVHNLISRRAGRKNASI